MHRNMTTTDFDRAFGMKQLLNADGTWDTGRWTSALLSNKSLLAFLGVSGASAAIALLRRRRRLNRESKRKSSEPTIRSETNGNHPRQVTVNGSAPSLGRPPSRSMSETFAWNEDGVDIGAVLGVDIGGTLSKLVYFEKKPPPAAESVKRPPEDLMEKKLEMKRTVSLGNLHDRTENKQALEEFYNFMDQASKMGEPGVRDRHLSAYSHALGGVLHFFHFETRFMDQAVEIISSSRVHRNIQALGCTGGGAFKFETFFFERLGFKMLKMDEMECLVRGLQFALGNIPEECFTYRPPSQADTRVNAGEAPGVGKENGHENQSSSGPDPKESWRNKRMREITEGTEKREYSVKVRRSIEDEPIEEAYPALVVSVGSGVSIIKVDGPADFKRVSGSSIGGGTYWGLSRLLTAATSYDESLEIASRGDSDRVDMLVGDIYGRGYSKFQLSSNTLASSFGKIGGMESPRGENSAVGEEDIGKALLVMISLNIGQVAYLNAKLFNTRRIYFVGNFLRHNLLSGRQLAFAIDYWSSGEMEALFLEHEGYLGALGAFLMSGTEEPIGAGASSASPSKVED